MKNKKEKVEEKQNLCTVGIKNDAAWYFVAQYLYLLDHFRIDDDEFTRLYQALSKYVDDKVNAFPNGDILRHRGVKPHKPHTADFTASCALASSDVVPATTDSVRAQSTANCAVCGARSFGESNPRGRCDKPKKYVAGPTYDEDWCIFRVDLPPKPYAFDSSMPNEYIITEIALPIDTEQ